MIITIIITVITITTMLTMVTAMGTITRVVIIDHHVPELSWAGLTALGVSGGLVPCESALILLLSAVALGRVGLGLLLLVAFSLGLALVLMAIGALVLFAKHLIPERTVRGLSAFRWLPVFSGAAVVCVGLVMTAVSLGWLGPKWMIG